MDIKKSPEKMCNSLVVHGDFINKTKINSSVWEMSMFKFCSNEIHVITLYYAYLRGVGASTGFWILDPA